MILLAAEKRFDPVQWCKRVAAAKVRQFIVVENDPALEFVPIPYVEMTVT